MGRDCASERVPIALAEGRPEDPAGDGLSGAALGDVASLCGFVRGAWFRAECAGFDAMA